MIDLFSPRCQRAALAALGGFAILTYINARADAPRTAELAPTDAARVLDRERQVILRGKLPDAGQVTGWAKSLGADGRWADIDYTNREPSTWKTSTHLSRLVAMARCLVDPASPLQGDASLQTAIERGLDDWIAHRYHNPNWWHNDIGVPMLARDIAVLLGDRLTGARRDGVLALIAQHGKARPGDGANTMWEAKLGLDYGLLTEDAAMAQTQSAIIAREIAVTRGEGVQSDGSFHQHGPRLQQFHYGGAFINDAATLGWELAGTPWALDAKTLNVVADCILNGGQWMERNYYTVPGTLDRSVSRPGALHNGNLIGIAKLLREALPSRAADLDALIARQTPSGGEQPLTGFRAFPRSDFTVYHRPNFSFFLKTVSSRTDATETTTNGENGKGRLLGCGDSYVLRDGLEYFDLPPVWNWNLISGITWAEGAGVVRRLPFVGSLGDGTVGLTAMDYAFAPPSPKGAPPTPPTLTARKLWACDGDVVVCLIGDLRVAGSLTAPVQTAMDQCLQRGPVTSGPMPAGQKSTVGTTSNWISQSGVAYFPLYGERITTSMVPVTGTWRSINRGGSDAPVTMPVFLPVLEQGTAPHGVASGFAIVGNCATKEEAVCVASAPTWKILKNEADCQAVAFADGTLMAAFYRAGSFDGGAVGVVSVDQPCLILVRGGAVRVCDPTQKGMTVTVNLHGKATAVRAPAGGLASKPI